MRRGWRGLLFAGLLLMGVSVSTWAQQSMDRQLQSFLLAVKANDFSFISRMDRLGLGPQTRDALGNNLLMLAIREGSPQMALLLLEEPQWRSKEILAYENQIGESAVMLAALAGQNQVLSRLIALGAEVNREGWSALHYAATSGHLATIELLLEHHAFIDAESPNKTTPLMMAARFNHASAVKALLKAGADPTVVNDAGMSARDYAIELQNRDLEFMLNLEEISFRNKLLESFSNVRRDSSLEEIVIESGGSVVVEPSERPTVKPVPAGEGIEVIQGIR
jgi:uncharacterized protein